MNENDMNLIEHFKKIIIYIYNCMHIKMDNEWLTMTMKITIKMVN